MRRIKKILAVTMVMVMALTALTFSASSESIADTAKSITSGQTISGYVPYENESEDYKISVKSSGVLTLNISIYLKRCHVFVFDQNGNQVDLASKNITCGNFHNDYRQLASWNDTLEQFTGKLTYKVNKGTYYIRVQNIDLNSTTSSNPGTGKYSFTATFPSSSTSSTSTSKGKVYYLRITMDKGDTLGIGAVVSSGTDVTWTTSNANVATVKNGKITAKAKGSTIITAKCGTSSQKIKIIVQ